MKVACIIENIATFGGTQKQFIRVSECLADLGHEINIFTTRLDPKVSDQLEKKFDVKVVEVDLKNNFAAFASIIEPELQHHDWVLVFDWDVYKLKYYLPHKKICWICNDAPYTKDYLGRDLIGRVKYNLKRKMQVMKERQYISMIDRIIVLDYNMKHRLDRLYHVSSEVIRSGIDMPPAMPLGKENQLFEYLSSKYHIRSKKFVFALGIAFRWRNYEVLIEAMKHIEEDLFLLIVAPDYYDKAYFHELVTHKGKSDKIILESNFISEEEKIVLLKNATCFVFPNVQQTWGLAPLEALSQKTVPIVSRECGVTEVLTDDTYALHFDPRNSQQLMSKILFLAHHEEQRERIANAGYAFVKKNLDWRTYTNNIMNCIMSEM